jgi:hypothetical protein
MVAPTPMPIEAPVARGSFVGFWVGALVIFGWVGVVVAGSGVGDVEVVEDSGIGKAEGSSITPTLDW